MPLFVKDALILSLSLSHSVEHTTHTTYLTFPASIFFPFSLCLSLTPTQSTNSYPFSLHLFLLASHMLIFSAARGRTRTHIEMHTTHLTHTVLALQRYFSISKITHVVTRQSMCVIRSHLPQRTSTHRHTHTTYFAHAAPASYQLCWI